MPTVHRAAPVEALGRALMADAETAVLLVDPRGRIASVNDAARRLLSLTPARARGRPAAEVLRPLVAGDEVVHDAFRSPRLERDVWLHGSGGEIAVRLHGYRIGRPPWVLLTLRDLTQTRRVQQELRRHERLATLGQLSAGVAHEIRNPLAGIGTSAQACASSSRRSRASTAS